MNFLFRAFALKWRHYPRAVKVLFALYALCFLWGTHNHVVDLRRGGFLPYTYAPLPFNIYWTSLTLLDPLAALLLFVLPYHGMVLAVAIMVSDIAVNLYAAYVLFPGTMMPDRALLSQMAFALFLFVTVPFAWKRLRKSRTSKTA
jgi:hypothetical protein